MRSADLSDKQPRNSGGPERDFMTAKDILAEIKPLGRESYKRVIMKHGVKEPCLGVKIEDLKKVQKRIGKDHQLALDLYATGIYDAMYLAGLIADDARMTRKDLQRWVEKADGGALTGSTVPGVAAGSRHGRELALKWIESDKDFIATAGWSTWSLLVAVKEDTELDLAELEGLLERVQNTIHEAPDMVRYGMNGFVIAVGAYVRGLTSRALQVAEKIGRVTADLGDNACQIPYAPDYIRKIEKRGAIGKKRKSAMC